MDVAELIRGRLKVLGYEQRELAAAVRVTPSFVSQLLKRKKMPPSPGRTDIYRKIEKFLKLPPGDLSKLAKLQRKEELKRRFNDPSVPLFVEVRELVLSKCKREKQKELRHIFEKEPFGEIERIVTQTLLDAAKEITKQGWKDENWLRLLARSNRKSYEEIRVIALDFLDSDIFTLSIQNSIYFLKPLIRSWDIDLRTFSMNVVLASSLSAQRFRRFAFVEIEPESSVEDEPGLRDFLTDGDLCGNITDQEVTFLRRLRLAEKKPNALYYYRELQNLRDPLLFHSNFFKRRVANDK